LGGGASNAPVITGAILRQVFTRRRILLLGKNFPKPLYLFGRQSARQFNPKKIKNVGRGLDIFSGNGYNIIIKNWREWQK